jgi:hypothetical protein
MTVAVQEYLKEPPGKADVTTLIDLEAVPPLLK